MDRIPHDLDAERALLGLMLVDPKTIDSAVRVLGRGQRDAFYLGAHQEIFDAILSLRSENVTVDVRAVGDELHRRAMLDKAGGHEYLVSLTESVPTSGNAEQYARIVRDQYLLRELLRTGLEIADAARTCVDDVGAMLDWAEQRLSSVCEQRIEVCAELAASAADTFVRSIVGSSAPQAGGLPAGLDALDQLIGGLHPGELIVIAGWPGTGKTALAVSMAEYLAVRREIPVAFFALEMSRVQLAQRLLASRAGVSLDRLRRGEISQAEREAIRLAKEDLDTAPLWIDDAADVNAFEVRAKSRSLRQQRNIQAVFLDYLQLLRPPLASPEAGHPLAVSMRVLKVTARELGIPVVVTVQLPRRPEGGSAESPGLSDVGGLGGIEEHADVIMLLRGEAPLPRQPGHPGANPREGIVITKHRNRRGGSVRVSFDSGSGRFGDWKPAWVDGGALLRWRMPVDVRLEPFSERTPTSGRLIAPIRCNYRK